VLQYHNMGSIGEMEGNLHLFQQILHLKMANGHFFAAAALSQRKELSVSVRQMARWAGSRAGLDAPVTL
jgi:hypothetical protein